MQGGKIAYWAGIFEASPRDELRRSPPRSPFAGFESLDSQPRGYVRSIIRATLSNTRFLVNLSPYAPLGMRCHRAEKSNCSRRPKIHRLKLPALGGNERWMDAEQSRMLDESIHAVYIVAVRRAESTFYI